MLIKNLRSPSDEDSSKRKTPLGLFSAQSLQIEERYSSASITFTLQIRHQRPNRNHQAGTPTQQRQ